MRKTIFVFVIAVMFKPVSAQISIGLSVGSNFCTVNQDIDDGFGEGEEETGYRDVRLTTGFGIGIPVEVKMSDNFSLSSGIHYLQKGSSGKSEIADLYSSMKVDGCTKFNYVEIPVQGKYYFVNNNIKVYGSAGAGVGYLFSAVAKHTITYTDFSDDFREVSEQKDRISAKEIKDQNVNQLDISLLAGAGIEYNVWVGRIFLNVNYIFGVSNMFKDGKMDFDEYGTEIDVKQFNRGLYTSFGYLIPLSQ